MHPEEFKFSKKNDLLSEIFWQSQPEQVLAEEAHRFTSWEVGEESPHELGRRLSTQLWRVDNLVELPQHIGGVPPDELGLESLVWVRQVVCCLQDVLKLGHRRFL